MEKLSMRFLMMMGLVVALSVACSDDDDAPPLLDPEITTLEPNEGPVGTAVTITGVNFGENPTVTFGTTSAEVTAVTDVSITTEVPEGVAVGAIQVTVNNDGATDDEDFTVTEATDDGGDGGDGGATMAAGDLIADNADLDSLEVALTLAGLLDDINNAEAVTVFAPSNAAFDAVLEATDGAASIADLVEVLGAETAVELLQNHVVVGTVAASEGLTDGQEVATLGGGTIVVGVSEDGTITVNDATVTTPDLSATNGVVHIIDQVLFTGEGDGVNPGDPDITTVTDTVVALDDLNSLEAAIGAADGDLATVLMGEGPFTLFAPNNEAFADLIEALGAGDLDGVVTAIGSDGLERVLLAHVVAGQTLDDEDLAGSTDPIATAQNGSTITVTTDGDATLINGAAIVTPNIEVGNGIVHIIAEVINTEAAESDGNEPDTPIGNLAAGTESLSSLTEALTLANLVGTLNDESVNYTVFAPDNAAFQAVIDATEGVSTVEELVNALGTETATSLLQNHVVRGEILSSDELTDGQEVQLLGGETAVVGVSDDGTITINGATVTTPDVRASNGRIHIINDVLYAEPEPSDDGDNGDDENSGTISDVAANTDDLSSLVEALGLAELVDNLSDENQTYTVFAPINGAFDAVIEATDGVGTVSELVAALNEGYEGPAEESPAATLLLNHVVLNQDGEAISSDGIEGETVVTTVGGRNITLNRNGDTITVTGADGTTATVTTADVEASNGIVHIIDAVINVTAEDSEGDNS